MNWIKLTPETRFELDEKLVVWNSDYKCAVIVYVYNPEINLFSEVDTAEFVNLNGKEVSHYAILTPPDDE